MKGRKVEQTVNEAKCAHAQPEWSHRSELGAYMQTVAGFSPERLTVITRIKIKLKKDRRRADETRKL
jgi:hypothetical protein